MLTELRYSIAGFMRKGFLFPVYGRNLGGRISRDKREAYFFLEIMQKGFSLGRICLDLLLRANRDSMSGSLERCA